MCWELDDAPYFLFWFFPYMSGLSTPSQVLEIWKAEFDGSYRAGGCFLLVVHPFCIGRYPRIAMLDELAHLRAPTCGSGRTSTWRRSGGRRGSSRRPRRSRRTPPSRSEHAWEGVAYPDMYGKKLKRKYGASLLTAPAHRPLTRFGSASTGSSQAACLVRGLREPIPGRLLSNLPRWAMPHRIGPQSDACIVVAPVPISTRC